MLKEHDLNFDSLNDFAVSGDISPNSGGIYREGVGYGLYFSGRW